MQYDSERIMTTKDVTLSSSVGIKSDNTPQDVLQVQQALNAIAETIGLTEPLAEDGQIIDDTTLSPTCRAISLLQTQLLGFRHPDGRIDCHGKSHHALNQALKQKLGVTEPFSLPEVEPQRGLLAQDFTDAAQQLGCDVAAIKAVSEVESSGSGFFDSGRPCLLFEAHQFSKFSYHHFDESHPDISSRKWDRSLYLGGEKEYDRLQKAMALDCRAALMSASYGRYQIMGFNYQAAGYDDVESYVRDMFASERNHLLAFARFIKSDNRLLKAIQSRDWPTFARYYNGPGYAENRYDQRLAAAYLKHSI
jgi:hypothetical protein